MKFILDSLFDDTLELDLMYNNVPERLNSAIDDVSDDQASYPILPVKRFTKEEIEAFEVLRKKA